MPVDPKQLPALHQHYQPLFEGLGVIESDVEYLYNLLEEAILSGASLESLDLPAEIMPFAKALYDDLRAHLSTPPPSPKQPVPPTVQETPVTGLKAALALLSTAAVDRLKAVFKRNPKLHDHLTEIGTALQRSGVMLVTRQPTGDVMGNLLPEATPTVDQGRDQGRGA
jgi:hypothetical protein